MTPLVIEIDVACPPDHAFRTWTEQISAWWPTSHSFSGDPDLTVTVEGEVGGRIFETAADGTEYDWGEVVAWDPPARLAFLWHLRFERADATDVDAAFTATPTGTRVTITHSGWERLGDAGPERRERNQAGWAGVLTHFVAACNSAPNASAG